MDAAERRAFVRDHHDAILGYNRRAHGPAMSFVYYVVAGDEILVSTRCSDGRPATRRLIAANGELRQLPQLIRVSLAELKAVTARRSSCLRCTTERARPGCTHDLCPLPTPRGSRDKGGDDGDTSM
ncbi:MAG TPA: hypothetical protein VEZ15_01540 [Acidimicrobiia bacterium]|nr:hypothetical protein [Acidimicrobiia bacterium]